MFRRLALAAAAALCVASIVPASAADIGNRGYVNYGRSAPFNWTGFYVGLNGGHTNGHVSESLPSFGPSGSQFGEFDPKGWFGGVQLGYNWQFSPRWVAGLEGDLNYGHIGASRSDSYSDPWYSASETQDATANWWGTARVRIGFLPTERLMIYGTGGAIFAKVKTSDTYAASSSWFGGSSYAATSSTSDWRAGWTIGGGAEYAFNDHWSMKGEYLYADIGLRNNQSSYSLSGYGGSSTSDTADLRAHIFRVGLNYRF